MSQEVLSKHEVEQLLRTTVTLLLDGWTRLDEFWIKRPDRTPYTTVGAMEFVLRNSGNCWNCNGTGLNIIRYPLFGVVEELPPTTKDCKVCGGSGNDNENPSS